MNINFQSEMMVLEIRFFLSSTHCFFNLTQTWASKTFNIKISSILRVQMNHWVPHRFRNKGCIVECYIIKTLLSLWSQIFKSFNTFPVTYWFISDNHNWFRAQEINCSSCWIYNLLYEHEPMFILLNIGPAGNHIYYSASFFLSSNTYTFPLYSALHLCSINIETCIGCIYTCSGKSFPT